MAVFDAIGLEPRFDLIERGRDDEHVPRPAVSHQPGTSLLLLLSQQYTSSSNNSLDSINTSSAMAWIP